MSAQTVEVSGTQEIDGFDVEWDATVRLYYRPAKLYGPPENCYPEESEAEILTLTTWPEKFEDKINEECVEELAWEKFDYQPKGTNAADRADYLNDINEER